MRVFCGCTSRFKDKAQLKRASARLGSHGEFGRTLQGITEPVGNKVLCSTNGKASTRFESRHSGRRPLLGQERDSMVPAEAT